MKSNFGLSYREQFYSEVGHVLMIGKVNFHYIVLEFYCVSWTVCCRLKEGKEWVSGSFFERINCS